MFKATLETMVKTTPGAVGAVLMGFDAIPIDQYYVQVEDVDLQLFAIEYTNVVKEIRKTAEILGTGDFQEVTIKSAGFHVVIRAVTDDYFLALTLQHDGNLGKGRFHMRRDLATLRQALI